MQLHAGGFVDEHRQAKPLQRCTQRSTTRTTRTTLYNICTTLYDVVQRFDELYNAQVVTMNPGGPDPN